MITKELTAFPGIFQNCLKSLGAQLWISKPKSRLTGKKNPQILACLWKFDREILERFTLLGHLEIEDTRYIKIQNIFQFPSSNRSTIKKTNMEVRSRIVKKNFLILQIFCFFLFIFTLLLARLPNVAWVQLFLSVNLIFYGLILK